MTQAKISLVPHPFSATVPESSLDTKLTSATESALRGLKFDQQQPGAELDKLADIHRRHVARYDQNVAETRKALKERVAELEATKKALREKYQAELAALDVTILAARDKSRLDLVALKRMSAASKAALEVLTLD